MTSPTQTPAWQEALRRLRTPRRPAEKLEVVLLLVALVLGTAWSIADNNRQIKVAGVVVIVIVLASLLLTTRGMLVVAAGVVLCLAVVFRVHGLNPGQLSVSGFAMIGIALGVAVAQARRRDRLGLRQMSAEKVISLIRDRLLVQSQLPELPRGWTVEVQQRAADGAAISGDFVSNRLVTVDGRCVLHLAVVDVSGNGIAAGPRSLLLSGAVGGLLGSIPPDEFLPAANDYLARQQWSLGFASAVYLVVDLASGEYQLRVAGHPPALHYRPLAEPTWRTSPAAGTVLGVLPSLTVVSDASTLAEGEALFLYTDGVVEDRTRDIDAGLLRLKDAVEGLANRDVWTGAARHLIEHVPAKQDDDRTVVVVRRSPLR
ncbi:serine/threonine-protein phosphatase [Jatrophihabitans telluris]|uniref:Serine/threonine-protein phosphatase n=1 Tax=Jatrophihabitans telluris TaxID=2038343 RepID=A0ABY4R166_9ACTN|nr:PP2C family protein-serine/threonine phosphatase [Jatrophihabitans telluris]UQX89658.1 serine/threonine-protein phosphatase [Jatrophihabitans telluris]